MNTVGKLLLASLLLLASSIATAATCSVVGLSGVAPVATINFPAVTVNTDGSAIAAPVTYNLYQGTAAGTETKVASNLVAGTANAVKTGLLPNTTAYFFITAVDANGNEGGHSNEACKSFPNVVPGTTTITVTWLVTIGDDHVG